MKRSVSDVGKVGASHNLVLCSLESLWRISVHQCRTVKDRALRWVVALLRIANLPNGRAPAVDTLFHNDTHKNTEPGDALSSAFYACHLDAEIDLVEMFTDIQHHRFPLL